MSAATGRLRPRNRIELGDYPVDAAWSGDGTALAVAGGEGAVLLLAASSQWQPQLIGRHPGGALALAWQKAGRYFASSGQDGSVLRWDARALQSRTILAGSEWSEHLAYADNGRLLAVASGRTLRLFDEQGELQHSLAEQQASIAAIAWRPGSAQIAAAGNGGVRLHRLPAAQAAAETRDYSCRGACLTARWNPDGRILAAGMQDGSVQLWHMAAGSHSQLQGMGAKVFATEWSAQGRYLAAAAASTLVIWDFAGGGAGGGGGARPLELRAHSERITAVRFAPTGTGLVSAARDRRLLLWRIGAGSKPLDAHLLPDECTLLRFTRDGRSLAAGDARGGLTIYDL
jgi:WD40 repeat protein